MPSVKADANSDYSPSDGNAQARRWLDPMIFATLPFHQLIPAEKLAAFAAMPVSLLRPLTIGEVERRQFFWQSLAAGVTAKEAALLDDSLHCRFTDSVADKMIEIEWEVHYYDELQGGAEMYRAELLAFKRRIYEAGDELRGILELKADEFLRYLNDLNFQADYQASYQSSHNEDFAVSSQARAVIETDDLERWFLDNLTGSFALTVSEFRNENEKPSENDKTGKTRKTKSPPSEHIGYRTYEAKRIESWMFSDGEEDEINPTGEAAVSRIERKSAGNGDNRNNADDPVEANQTEELEEANQAGETESKDLNEPTSHPKSMLAADSSLNISTAVYRLRLADYWLDWQQAARAARFDFDFLETLPDVRAMRFYELTKLWRLQSFAETGAIITGGGASDVIPDTLEIEYNRFAALMPLPRLRFEREIKEQLRSIIKPLKASGYVVSFAVKPDWRGLDNADRLIFRFAD